MPRLLEICGKTKLQGPQRITKDGSGAIKAGAQGPDACNEVSQLFATPKVLR